MKYIIQAVKKLAQRLSLSKGNEITDRTIRIHVGDNPRICQPVDISTRGYQ